MTRASLPSWARGSRPTTRASASSVRARSGSFRRMRRSPTTPSWSSGCRDTSLRSRGASPIHPPSTTSRPRESTAMVAADQIEIRRLDGDALRAQLDALAAVLADCVAGGASVSYMEPFSHADARAAFDGFASEVEAGRSLLLAAHDGETVVGTVQVLLAFPPNQPHGGEFEKLLVHRSARKHGIAQRLMERAESEARAAGKTLLVLDTVTGDNAERLYTRLGWTRVGVIPAYAPF